MNSGLLDFFVLEASECVERLDGMLSRAAAPDVEGFVRDARALRGSATMAKVSGIAEVAAGLERIARGLREGTLHWSPALRGATIAAVDDLKILIRGVRTWGSDEERRASARVEELLAQAPAARRHSSATPSTAGGGAGFLATETAEVAAGLLRVAADPSPGPAFSEVARRLRALRGVAALIDLPPLAEVVAAVDEAVKQLEIRATAPTDAQRALFRAAAAVLREGSAAVQAGARPDPGSDAVHSFATAAELAEGALDHDQVVPIASLFPDDGADHVLHAAPNPPTTPPQRFKLEVVPHAEHLRRLVSDARRAADAPTRRRVGRELRAAVVGLERAAESFNEHVVARALHACVDGAAVLEARVLAALDEASRILSTPGDVALAARFEALAGTAPTPVRSSTPIRAATPIPSVPAVATSATVAPPQAAPLFAAPKIPSSLAPSGPALHEMLGKGIAGLSKLGDEPLSQPVAVDDDGVVPIQDLLYRGRAALQRAIQLGGSLKKAAAGADADALTELYDLLELAATE